MGGAYRAHRPLALIESHDVATSENRLSDRRGFTPLPHLWGYGEKVCVSDNVVGNLSHAHPRQLRDASNSLYCCNNFSAARAYTSKRFIIALVGSWNATKPLSWRNLRPPSVSP